MGVQINKTPSERGLLGQITSEVFSTTVAPALAADVPDAIYLQSIVFETSKAMVTGLIDLQSMHSELLSALFASKKDVGLS